MFFCKRLLRNLLIILNIVILMSFAASQVFAGSVNINRILSEHQITVVTTEAPDSLSKNLISKRIKLQGIISFADYAAIRNKMGKDQSVLFLIDREKCKQFSDADEKSLPFLTSLLDSDEVILYAVKSKGRNAWEMMVSGPNEKWLKLELDRLANSSLRGLSLNESGTILDRYRVKRLAVISNEDLEIAKNWIDRQSIPGQDAIDWDFIKAQDWKPQDYTTTNLLFILNREDLNKDNDIVIETLPQAAKAWIKNNQTANELIMQVQRDTASRREIYCVAGPGNRLLRAALSQLASLDSIPMDIQKRTFIDLRNYSKIAAVAVSNDRDFGNDTIVADELAGKLTSRLNSVGGFECVSRQDLKDLISSIQKGQRGDISEFRNQFGKAAAIAVIDISSVNAYTSYIANAPVCQTTPYGDFNEIKPGEPHRPDPDDKPLFSAHKYDAVNGDRANDPNYKRDYREWRDVLMPGYRDNLSEWHRRRHEHEENRRSHEMQYLLTVDSVQSIKISGNFHIYDLGAEENMGKDLFSCPINVEFENRSVIMTDYVIVRGEENIPASLITPPSTHGVIDETIISDAYTKACQQAVSKMATNSILPSD